MKLATVRVSAQQTWGLVTDGTFHDLGAVLGKRLPDLKSVLAADAVEGLASHVGQAPAYPLAQVAWLPVIPNPDKILCIGLNYETHRKETGRAEVGHPTVFSRYASSQTGHGKPIIRPKVSTHLDYEGELAVIIGKPGRYIEQAHAFEHIAGYACYNDGSIRDWQLHTHQYTPGKNFPATGAFGPWLVTRDEIDNVEALRLQTRLNGTVVQDAHVSDMIFHIPRLIEYCSAFTRLEPGDVLVTGTPGGVGAKHVPPLWMKPGDTVEVEIERVGLLVNTIADE